MTSSSKQNPQEIENQTGNPETEALSLNMTSSYSRRNFVRTALMLGSSLAISGSAAFVLLSGRRGAGNGTGTPMVKGGFNGFDRESMVRISRQFDHEMQTTWNTTSAALWKAQENFEEALSDAGKFFAEEKLTRTNILSLVYDMARDHLDGGNRTDQWLESNFNPWLLPAIQRHENAMRIALDQFERGVFLTVDNRDRDLREALTSLREAERTDLAFEIDREAVRQNLRLAIATPGQRHSRGAAVAGAGLAIGVAGSLTQRLAGIVRQSLQRVLRPVVARIAARIAAAPLGTIPVVGWVLVGGGAIWTGVDIIRLSSQTKAAFEEGLNDVMVETRTEMRAFTDSLEGFLLAIQEEKSRADERLLAAL